MVEGSCRGWESIEGEERRFLLDAMRCFGGEWGAAESGGLDDHSNSYQLTNSLS